MNKTWSLRGSFDFKKFTLHFYFFMEILPLDFTKTHIYGSLPTEYLKEDNFFESFISNFPNEQGYKNAILQKKFPKENRQILHAELKKQYEILDEDNVNQHVRNNIKALIDENTFTITTGQQIHIYGGPLYVYAKILSTIKKCRELAEKFPEKKFVPVFWMAGEDHDFEEINHINLFGKKIAWNRPELFEGPVGKMPLDTIHELTNQLKEMFKNDAVGAEILAQFDEVYHSYSDLETATFALLNKWFGAYGLVILNPNNSALKRIFLPAIIKEITKNVSKTTVEKTSQKLAQKYTKQAQPKDINLFYINDKRRQRIEIENGIIHIDGTKETYTLDAFIKLIELHPENISPNVILRPVFQETILPNIAYIGGPGELAYWLQLKDNFENFGVSYPIFDLRKSILPINLKNYEKALKIFDNVYFWFNDLKFLLETLIDKNGVKSILEHSSIHALKENFDEISNELISELPMMESTMQIEKLKIEEILEKINAKYIKIQKQSFDQELKQIEHIKNKYFNQKTLIERTESILSNHYILDLKFIENFLNAEKISILNLVIH